jgi:hypothetical protein
MYRLWFKDYFSQFIDKNYFIGLPSRESGGKIHYLSTFFERKHRKKDKKKHLRFLTPLKILDLHFLIHIVYQNQAGLLLVSGCFS